MTNTKHLLTRAVLLLALGLTISGSLIYTDIALYDSKIRCNSEIRTLFWVTILIHIWLLLMSVARFIDTIKYAYSLVNIGTQAIHVSDCTIFVSILGVFICFTSGIMLLIIVGLTENIHECINNVSAVWYIAWHCPGVCMIGLLALGIVCGVLNICFAGLLYFVAVIQTIHTSYVNVNVDEIEMV